VRRVYGLLGSVFLFISAGQAQDVAIDLNPVRIFERTIGAPAFWGIEITGSDLAKEVVRQYDIKPVNVVVSDARTSQVKTEQIAYTHQPSRRVLNLLAHTTDVTNLELKEFTSLGMDDWIDFAIDKFPETTRSIIGKYDSQHADHVAGIIGADGHDFGVSEKVRIFSLDVFGTFKVARDSTLESAYKHLLDGPDPVDVMNMSHGLGTETAIAELLRGIVQKKNTVCVISANNMGAKLDPTLVVSQVTDCIIVGSFSRTGLKSDFSNFGAAIDLVAPGEDILSFGSVFSYKGKQIEPLSGTSMSAPMVSGAAAELKALLPSANSEDVRNILRETAIDLGIDGRDPMTGHGLLNTFRAVKVAERLRRNTDGSPHAIASALKNKSIYDFTEESRQTFLKSKSQGNLDPLALRTLRRAVLLNGRPESFAELAHAYRAQSFNEIADGCELIAANRHFQKLKASDRELYGQRLAFYHQSALASSLNFFIIQSIANPDLLLAMYRHLENSSANLSELEFEKQMKLIAPERLGEFQQMSRQRLFAPLKSAQVAIRERAK
jgi:hypothetical protein